MRSSLWAVPSLRPLKEACFYAKQDLDSSTRRGSPFARQTDKEFGFILPEDFGRIMLRDFFGGIWLSDNRLTVKPKSRWRQWFSAMSKLVAPPCASWPKAE